MNGRRMPSPALVIAVAALFVSLGGTAIAAGVVPLAKRGLVADNAKKVGARHRRSSRPRRRRSLGRRARPPGS